MTHEREFTSDQRACMEISDGPLVVSAGAGSGKTLVLTQKIVRALAGESNPDGHCCDVGEILAITFTEKAAEELRFRLKAALRAKGMREQALRVDEAWVSTIHGMCFRMLKEHAFELGLDPSFEILGEVAARRFLDEAIEEALLLCRKKGMGAELDALFREYPSYSTGRAARESVRGMVKTLVRKAVARANGMEGFSLVAEPRSAARLIEAFFEMSREAEALVVSQRESLRRACWLESAQAFFMQEGLIRSLPDSAGVLKCAELCPRPAADFGTRSYKDAAKSLQSMYADLLAEAEGLLAAPFANLLLVLARFAYESYTQKKHGRGFLDNDDLLILTASALRENRRMAKAYADRFKLVLVDEFQDTDELQLQIIQRLSGVSGERLCVVGDAQQSIYRFRGADASLIRRHIEWVKGIDARRAIELKDNFRSHEDVLAFVDGIFRQEDIGSYMPLRASRVSGKAVFPPSARRLQVLRTTYKGACSAAREVEARRIAQAFKSLREQGCSPRGMALLLGRMTNADVYARAMRREGLPCIIGGGSTFAQAPEVLVVKQLLDVLASPGNTIALHNVLLSEMFGLDSNDMLALGSRLDDSLQRIGKRPIDEGIRELFFAGNQGSFSRKAERAARVIGDACYGSRGECPSRIAMRCVVDSGWMARLEARGAEGLAVAANILKAIRVIEKIEREEARGPVSVASAFAAYLESAKEGPGVLSGLDDECVRIMTVHASKGLEFPVVAVAEMDRPAVRPSALLCEPVGEEMLVSLRLGARGSRFRSAGHSRSIADDVQVDFQDGLSDGFAYAASRRKLESHERMQEAQERRRLLYVALTRAQEAIVLSLLEKSSASQAGEGISDLVRRTLFGDGVFPEDDVLVSVRGGADVFVECVRAEDELTQEVESETSRDSGVCEETYPILCNEQARQTRRFVRPSCRGAGGSGSTALSRGNGNDAEDREFWSDLRKELDAEAAGGMRMELAFRDAVAYSVDALRRAKRDGEPLRMSAPDDKSLEAIADRRGLEPRLRMRLRCALEQWVSSEEAQGLERGERIEVGISVPMRVLAGYGEGCFEQSEDVVDYLAFCPEGDGRSISAFAVCFEGALREGSSEQRFQRQPLLRAACCALALFRYGFDSVEVAIRSIRQDDCVVGEDCVRYVFDKDKEEELRALAQDAYARSIE